MDRTQFPRQEWVFMKTSEDFDAIDLEYKVSLNAIDNDRHVRHSMSYGLSKGFCSYSIATFDRLLVPSNPHIGVLRHRERNYSFSSRQAAEKFASDPDRCSMDVTSMCYVTKNVVFSYILGVIEVAKKSPELIQLLELHSQFAAMSPHSHGMPAGKMIEKPVIMCDAGVQTEVHPIETNIVKSYEWNEWELRRKAIKLVRDINLSILFSL